MDAKNEGNKIKIELSSHEAIVFFEWLARFNEKSTATSFEDQAEERVLWNLEAVLEKNMNEFLENNYEELLRKARGIVRD